MPLALLFLIQLRPGRRHGFPVGPDGVRSHGVPRVLTLPKLIRRRSKVHGFGVFAAEPISKNKRIIDYAGELVSNGASEAREERYLADGCIWVFRVNRRFSRDAAVGGNIARFINHACRPNCWIEVAGTTIWIRASRSIRKGEEVTYDYATDGEQTIPCRCRPGCTNKF
jgi:uncharacterized protein